MKVTILGSGSWGTALAILLGAKDYAIRLWGRREDQTQRIQQARENEQYLPGFKLPEQVECTEDITYALSESGVVVLAVPSSAVREVLREIKPYVSEDLLIIHAGKGLESESALRGSEIVAQEMDAESAERTVVLSGPNLAVELAKGVPSATVVASKDAEATCRAQELFHCGTLRVYRSADAVGVELGGALKNVLAIGAGISDGMGFGDNTKATLITRGLAEMVRLGTHIGAERSTFMGLSGIGDLVATCSSRLSRNLRMGLMLGEGLSLEESKQKLGQVAEGVDTCKAAYQLSERCGVNMPITREIYGILFEHKSPKQGLMDLMNRSHKEEIY